MEHFADRLLRAVKTKGNSLCVGLDPRWDSIPEEIRERHPADDLSSVAAVYEEFCIRILDIVAPLVAIVKPQSAFFEACGPAGMAALQQVIMQARRRELLVILDSKRNDIASTATAYADAAFGGIRHIKLEHPVWNADALTINAYLGKDSIEPFLESARRSGRGIFVLVRTSNAGASQFQDLKCQGRPLFVHVSEAVAKWSLENVGKCGFGDVGAVVGATHPEELGKIRQLIRDVMLLVPGFGTQGGSAADVASAFREDGQGAIINSSRGIIFSYSPSDPNWEKVVEQATIDAIKMLHGHTSMRHLRP